MSIWDERVDTDLDEDRPRRPLVRSRSDRVICGVCGGIARAAGIDPLVVRLAAVALALIASGVAIPAYFVLAIVMRRSPGEWAETSRRAGQVSRHTLGWMLVVGGAFLLLHWLQPWIDTRLVVGLVMVVVGINVILRHRR